MRLKDESKQIAKEKGMLNTVQAAKFLDYSRAALNKWRSNGEGPAYYKGKGGMVFYERADLIAFKKKVSLTRVEPRPRSSSAPATIPA
jgi:helix-turn-helix protein